MEVPWTAESLSSLPRRTLSMLGKYCANLLAARDVVDRAAAPSADPREAAQKLRKIKRTNAAFAERVAPHALAHAVLHRCGYRACVSDAGAVDEVYAYELAALPPRAVLAPLGAILARSAAMASDGPAAPKRPADAVAAAAAASDAPSKRARPAGGAQGGVAFGAPTLAGVPRGGKVALVVYCDMCHKARHLWQQEADFLASAGSAAAAAAAAAASGGGAAAASASASEDDAPWECAMLARLGNCVPPDDEVAEITGDIPALALERLGIRSRGALAAASAEEVAGGDAESLCDIRGWVAAAQRAEISELMDRCVAAGENQPDGRSSAEQQQEQQQQEEEQQQQQQQHSRWRHAYLAQLEGLGITTPRDMVASRAEALLARLDGSDGAAGSSASASASASSAEANATPPPPTLAQVARWQEAASAELEACEWAGDWVCGAVVEAQRRAAAATSAAADEDADLRAAMQASRCDFVESNAAEGGPSNGAGGGGGGGSGSGAGPS